VLACVRRIGALPVTVLAVPRYHGGGADAGFEQWLDAALADGDELALHGLTHIDDGRPMGLVDHARRRWYTAGEGEFAALRPAEAAERLALGRRWFCEHGWPLHGFVAPAWLMSAGTWQALDALGFEYTCTLRSVVSLPQHAGLASRGIVYSTRSGWRRALSLPWNAAVAGSQRRRPLLRFELHPADADHPAIRRSWMGLLERALAGREAVTLREAARRIGATARTMRRSP
jgi:predicted deacetylase